jgi:hypothetical protein
LLKIEKKKTEIIRWNEVEELHTNRGNITWLQNKDKSKFFIPEPFYRQLANQKLSTLIGNEVSRLRLPSLLTHFDAGETITIGTLEANKKGLYRPDMMLPWTAIGAVKLRKGTLKIYGYQVKHVFAKKELLWCKWISDSALHSQPPDLPLFAALINAILEREQDSVQRERIHRWQAMAFKRSRFRLLPT